MADAENTEDLDELGDPPEESEHGRPSDWGSLVADLATPLDADPRWRIHDRTHLEFAVDYGIPSDTKEVRHEWEAYFFVPASLRLDKDTYPKSEIYSDLRSYIRYAVPDIPFGELAGESVDELGAALESDEDTAVRELRLFACQVRASGLRAIRRVHDALTDGHPDERSTALAAAARLAADARHLTTALREVLSEVESDDSKLDTAARWIDEDVSRVIETLFGELAVELGKSGAPKKLVRAITDVAVDEARYRRDGGLDGVGHVHADKREVEHLEFRRHVLKRFSSSVLWLQPQIREGARWAIQALYAVAAGIAMAFAIGTAFLNGPDFDRENASIWITLAIFAYMGKDRIKAILQSTFSSLVDRRFPDRRWRIRDKERDQVIGVVDERSAFVKFQDLPEGALEKRIATREHELEAEARPERVLWHKKSASLRADRVEDRFRAVTEIFRLDLTRWLAHTDDPKRKIVFADPGEGRVCSSTAPRVYNIGVVYRLREVGQEQAPWRRIRVVVSRKGIRRIDHIGASA